MKASGRNRKHANTIQLLKGVGRSPQASVPPTVSTAQTLEIDIRPRKLPHLETSKSNPKLFIVTPPRGCAAPPGVLLARFAVIVIMLTVRKNTLIVSKAQNMAQA